MAWGIREGSDNHDDMRVVRVRVRGEGGVKQCNYTETGSAVSM